MNWLIIFIGLLAIAAVVGWIALFRDWCDFIKILCVVLGTISILMLLGPMAYVCGNVERKHEYYMETRLKYAEAEGVEKMGLEMNDVMTYNLWYSKNKEDLENPWNFKSAAGCEFDYIKVGD